MLFRQAPVVVLPARDLGLSVDLVAAKRTYDPVRTRQITKLHSRSAAILNLNRALVDPKRNKPLEGFPLFPLFPLFLRLLAALLRLVHRRRQESGCCKLDQNAGRPGKRNAKVGS